MPRLQWSKYNGLEQYAIILHTLAYMVILAGIALSVTVVIIVLVKFT